MRSSRRAFLIGWAVESALAAAGGCSSAVPEAWPGEVEREITFPQLAQDPRRTGGAPRR